MIKHYLKKDGERYTHIWLADYSHMNGDGKLNAVDLTLLKRKLLQG